MQWIATNYQLPEHRQTVLILLHDDATPHSATFRRGRTAQRVKADGVRSWEDQAGNNTVPYGWDGHGPFRYFGQDVAYWTPLPETPINAPESIKS